MIPDLTPFDFTPAPWVSEAACKTLTHLFYPARGEATLPAKQICARCPVLEQCAKASWTEPAGVWGGISRRELRPIKNARRQHGTHIGWYQHLYHNEPACEPCQTAQTAHKQRLLNATH